MRKAVSLSGLYAITDSGLVAPDQLPQAVLQAIRGGARLIQYRDKQSPKKLRTDQARSLQALCQQTRIPLIINDDVDLAVQVGAAGVHIGQDDVCLEEARTRLGEQAIIGVSCYNSLQLARDARTGGADYVAFGSFYPSAIKPTALRADLDLLREARRTLDLPLCAIGGITPNNGRLLVAAGADMLAVISEVFGTGDPQVAARAFAPMFESQRARR